MLKINDDSQPIVYQSAVGSDELFPLNSNNTSTLTVTGPNPTKPHEEELNNIPQIEEEMS
ncbi:hypothetical protein PCASD_03080 [Puccinia coronata f. sp. avenae]|uniref:Uncharacterized protein n=1 Tax=Puccinia coronata f. sp. avenae TaxID=200324 RepID=A0A2N5V5S9_9BASI|nr:hypothetical protein PCASD_11092 [Puccinia coronata f. sp. avenae]PLW45340.1 hypothetical protein PCASD_03080 [Puccinia coronata f. sp. avenae]